MKTEDIGRNDACPCGNGKKFKYCCLGKENDTASRRRTAACASSNRFSRAVTASRWPRHRCSWRRRAPQQRPGHHGLQQVALHPARDAEELTPRLWKERFADNQITIRSRACPLTSTAWASKNCWNRQRPALEYPTAPAVAGERCRCHRATLPSQQEEKAAQIITLAAITVRNGRLLEIGINP
jgi:hypothetical protein